MAYFAPHISASGLHIPTYADILADQIAQAKLIFGSDIYLGNDTMDYQYISAVSLKISDTLQSLQLAYNNQSPTTAVGAGLDAIVKINGIKRKSASYSTCQVTLTGTPGTVISGGIIADVNNINWDLPDVVAIGNSGTVTVSAVCQVLGAISALAGNITTIVTPTAGWISVTNSYAAIAGQPVEEDSQLRARQALSTATPSRTVFEGIYGAILSVANVSRAEIYENDTDTVDANGLPGHSITAVVEGGTDEDIANAIYLRKTPGAYTNGTTDVYIQNIYNQTSLIRFYRPTYVPVDVTVNLKKFKGYTTATTAAIKQSISDYLNGLRIGDDLAVSSMWYAALSVMPNPKNPLFSISSLVAGRHGESQSMADIVTLFNEVSQGDVLNIVVNVT